MARNAQIVDLVVTDLVGLHLLGDANQIVAVRKVAGIVRQAQVSLVLILIEVINSAGVVREVGRRQLLTIRRLMLAPRKPFPATALPDQISLCL
jgi:hypothetical protein